MSNLETLLEFKSLRIISSILDRLSKELPTDLYYHNFSHTEDVMHEVLVFSSYDSLSRREKLLLSIAAAYHDAGFLVSKSSNELIGAKMAAEAMRDEGGFLDEEITVVSHCIEDTMVSVEGTWLGQMPRSHIAGYLLDADMSNLGREDFLEKAEAVAKENNVSDMKAFWKITLTLITSKLWYTPAGRMLRSDACNKNIQNLRASIEDKVLLVR